MAPYLNLLAALSACLLSTPALSFPTSQPDSSLAERDNLLARVQIYQNKDCDYTTTWGSPTYATSDADLHTLETEVISPFAALCPRPSDQYAMKAGQVIVMKTSLNLADVPKDDPAIYHHPSRPECAYWVGNVTAADWSQSTIVPGSQCCAGNSISSDLVERAL